MHFPQLFSFSALYCLLSTPDDGDGEAPLPLHFPHRPFGQGTLAAPFEFLFALVAVQRTLPVCGHHARHFFGKLHAVPMSLSSVLSPRAYAF